MFDSPRGGLTRIRWLPCQNTTANDIPGFAVMRVTGVADPSTTDNEYVLTVDQPNSSPALYCVNGPQVIKAQSGTTPGWGICSVDFPNFVLYDSGTGTPSIYDDWGPKSGSWKLNKDYTGFKIIGNPTEGRVLVQQNPGAGAWLGVLAGTLNYHSSASVTLYKWDSGSGYFISAGTTDTCYPWLMLSGDSIPSGTQVVGCIIDGKRVVFDAACNTGT